MTSTQRATYWGPNTQFATKTFPEQRALAEQRGWKVEGQEETCPTTGRKHYQFWVKTPQVRMSEVKKVFAGAHIEVARNVKAVQQYCAKEDTRSGSLPQASDKYPSQDKLFKLFGEWITNRRTGTNGWLYDDEGYRRRNVRGDVWLQMFDECCSALIMKGYRVESLAVNPAIRSAIKKFGDAIFDRYITERDDERWGKRAEDRQTDRQAGLFSHDDTTDENADSVSTRNHSAEGPSSDGASSASQDYEDGECSADEGDSQGTGDDGSEASDGTCDSE